MCLSNEQFLTDPPLAGNRGAWAGNEQFLTDPPLGGNGGHCVLACVGLSDNLSSSRAGVRERKGEQYLDLNKIISAGSSLIEYI